MKKIILAVTLLIILAAIPISIFLVKSKKEQTLRLKAAPATVLSLEPATLAKNMGETFAVNIHINTGENQIVSVDLVLSYNPQILEGTDITMGTFLTNATEIQKTINNQTGKIIYSFYTASANAKSGEGTLATISFKGKAAGISSVAFDPQSAVGALQEGSNVLNNTISGSYTITGGATPTPTSTPTPTPTSGLTPTPTSGLTSTPTPTGSLTPTPTTSSGQGGGTIPTSTPTPTPTRSLTSAPTPTGFALTLTPTPTSTLPVTGVFTPIIFLLGGGGIFLLFAFFLAM